MSLVKKALSEKLKKKASSDLVKSLRGPVHMVTGMVSSKARKQADITNKRTNTLKVKKILRDNGFAHIADDPKKYAEFRIFIRLPEKKIQKKIGKTLALGITSIMTRAIKNKLTEVTGPGIQPLLDLGSEALAGLISEKGSDILLKHIDKGVINKDNILGKAKAYTRYLR